MPNITNLILTLDRAKETWATSNLVLDFVPFGQYKATSIQVTQFGDPRLVFERGASGFSSTQIGIPRILNTVKGFTTTESGFPFAVFSTFANASGFKLTGFGAHSTPLPVAGWKTTQFGAPFAIFRQDVQPVGFKQTAFSAPIGIQHWDAESWTPVTHLGIPTTPTNRSAQVLGFSQVRIGAPMAFRWLPPSLLQYGRVTSFTSVAFGEPDAAWFRTGVAAGLATGYVGMPRSVTRQGVAGFSSTVFSAPLVRAKQTASGFKPATFGTPTARIAQAATGLHKPARFGLPTTLRSRTYRAYGFTCSGKFGHPRGFSRFNYPATGGAPATRLGTPACYQRHRALISPPVTQFGAPLLLRNTFCGRTGRASGLRGTQFGTPRAGRIQLAQGFSPTQVGAPTT